MRRSRASSAACARSGGADGPLARARACARGTRARPGPPRRRPRALGALPRGRARGRPPHRLARPARRRGPHAVRRRRARARTVRVLASRAPGGRGAHLRLAPLRDPGRARERARARARRARGRPRGDPAPRDAAAGAGPRRVRHRQRRPRGEPARAGAAPAQPRALAESARRLAPSARRCARVRGGDDFGPADLGVRLARGRPAGLARDRRAGAPERMGAAARDGARAARGGARPSRRRRAARRNCPRVGRGVGPRPPRLDDHERDDLALLPRALLLRRRRPCAARAPPGPLATTLRDPPCDHPDRARGLRGAGRGLLMRALAVLPLWLLGVAEPPASLACGSLHGRGAEASSQAVPVVATIVPLAWLVEEVGGARVSVCALVPPGASPHAYEPRPSDLARVADARLLVVAGRGVDDWVARLAVAEGPAPFALLDALGALSDPHFWLDPIAVRDAALPALEAALAAEDPEGREHYAERRRAFAERLTALDAEIRSALTGVARRPLVPLHDAWGAFAG